MRRDEKAGVKGELGLQGLGGGGGREGEALELQKMLTVEGCMQALSFIANTSLSQIS